LSGSASARPKPLRRVMEEREHAEKVCDTLASTVANVRMSEIK
jgi:hypothetical protein